MGKRTRTAEPTTHDPEPSAPVANPERGVCLFLLNGRVPAWSGFNATGDPNHAPYWLRVDVGGDHYVTDHGQLIVPRVSKTEGFTTEGLAIAARSGWFGFRVVEGPGDEPLTRPAPKRTKKGAGQQGYG